MGRGPALRLRRRFIEQKHGSNTFTPVEDPELRRRILDMAEHAGIRVRRIDQMDASRRTRHTNTYFAGLLLQSLAVFASPAAAAVSRRFEREADRFALSLAGTSEGLCRALKKMARDNLTNLFPHPPYVALHHSHPPNLDRLERLACTS